MTGNGRGVRNGCLDMDGATQDRIQEPHRSSLVRLPCLSVVQGVWLWVVCRSVRQTPYWRRIDAGFASLRSMLPSWYICSFLCWWCSAESSHTCRANAQSSLIPIIIALLTHSPPLLPCSLAQQKRAVGEYTCPPTLRRGTAFSNGCVQVLKILKLNVS